MTYYKANMCLTSNDIQHFGVPGMKWGVRKAQSIKSTVKKKRKEKISKNIDNAISTSNPKKIKKYMKYMSDEQVNTATRKLQARNNLKQAVKNSHPQSQLKQQITNKAISLSVTLALAGTVGAGYAMTKGKNPLEGGADAMNRVARNFVGIKKED